jgi:hypothetical protein
MADKPTRKWLEDQIRFLEISNLQNQGAINLCKAMIENGIFAEENEVNDNGAG